ncbi:Ral guanine nucleotide dissociation stimulator-like 1 [Elysia marginata]|uniref:Ral guanine nucleotide dissociation stimulator-like 1 n=1 Tax=Elysia marginata TaxID=1093978 RepID=A0AAV4EUU0_9GAST|nr:Ral guanine nucleotide dissociation stimulator-like 1 [Elysia marginata]
MDAERPESTQPQLEDEHHANGEFSHLMWETHKVRTIRAGTLVKLVESLTNNLGEMDSTYVNVFLATYRTFAKPHQFLTTLIERYKYLRSQRKKESSQTELIETQLRSLMSVVWMWLGTYPEDFQQDRPDYTCLRDLDKFAREFMPGSDLHRRVKEKLAAFEEEDAHEVAGRLGILSMSEGSSHPVDTDGSKSLALLEISCRTIAEQLTCKDADLFCKVVPHHCLGAVWSRREKAQGRETPTVQATIDQFNAVLRRVIATVLKTKDLRTSLRAKVLQKWIIIAQDLRELKNFSSLKAIITGLQSHPVYRLRKTWTALSKDTMTLFEELSEIFSVENNEINSRELLMKEATAKFPDLDSQSKSLKRRNMQKRRSWIDNGIVQGTVPYLGTFLTDLTMIDTAHPDTVDGGLINFDKRRKEFEVLAQLRLLQSAAKIYNIHEHEGFWRWFKSIRTYSDAESDELSISLEPQSESLAKIKKKSASLGNKPSRSETAKHGLFVCGSEETRTSIASIPDTIAASLGPLVNLSHSSSASSVISSDSDTASPLSPYKSSDCYVIKVSLENGHSDSTHVYKSIMLMNSDHTQVVIEKIMEKYGLEGSPHDYCLLQLLPDGELLIPSRCNVFYALNNSVDLKFILRTQQDHEMALYKRKGGRRRAKKMTV